MTQHILQVSNDGLTKWDRFNMWLTAVAAVVILALGTWALLVKA